MSAYIKRDHVLEILHELGGCGTKPETWENGWDSAINAAYDKIEREPYELFPTEDEVVELLWDGLTDIPFDPETEQSEEAYYIWPKGTDKEEIWHWFDENHSKGVAHLLGFA